MARLLLVDDDPTQLKYFCMLLETSGHQIDAATTLPQALERLAAVPDLLVMDLRLPEVKDGLLLIRQAGAQPSTRIVVLSGWPEELGSEPEAKLVDHVLAKPVRPAALLRVIRELSTSARARAHNPPPAGS